MAKLSYMSTYLPVVVVSLFILFFPEEVVARTFTFINSCDQTVWPGIYSTATSPYFSTTGFALENGERRIISPPSSWGGRVWARTYCTTNNSTSQFTCQTGDWGSGKVECAGSGGETPNTLVEFTLDSIGGQDFYDVSVLEGYNVPILVTPWRGTGVNNCSSTGCIGDLNGVCPAELRVVSEVGDSVVACKSACAEFNATNFCCSGAYGSLETCGTFKKACPTAFTYSTDDQSTTFTCGGSPDYTITFCPMPSTTTSQNASTKDHQQGTTLETSLEDSTKVHHLLDSTNSAGASTMTGKELPSAVVIAMCFASLLHLPI